MTRAPASAAPIAAPRPAGPPPTPSTSASPPSVAWRAGSAIRAAASGRLSAGKAHLRAVEQLHRKGVVLLRAGLERGNVLQKAGPERPAPVPALVDVRHEAAGIHELERRCRHLQVLEEAGHLA